MSLWEEMDANDKKGLFKSDDFTVSYPTGITVLDYANGYWNTVIDKDGKKIQVPQIGLPAGSMNSVIGTTGTGKALPNNMKIPTPNGYKRMGDLKVGDKVLNNRGEYTEVLGVYPQGKKEVWQLGLADLRCPECSGDHLWSVYLTNGEDLSKQQIDNRTITKMRKTMSTKEIYDAMKKNQRVFIRNMKSVVSHSYQTVPFDPIVVGIIIASIDLRASYFGGGVYLTNVNKDAVKYLTKALDARAIQVGNTYRLDFSRKYKAKERLKFRKARYYTLTDLMETITGNNLDYFRDFNENSSKNPDDDCITKLAKDIRDAFVSAYDDWMMVNAISHLIEKYLYNTISNRMRFISGFLWAFKDVIIFTNTTDIKDTQNPDNKVTNAFFLQFENMRLIGSGQPKIDNLVILMMRSCGMYVNTIPRSKTKDVGEMKQTWFVIMRHPYISDVFSSFYTFYKNRTEPYEELMEATYSSKLYVPDFVEVSEVIPPIKDEKEVEMTCIRVADESHEFLCEDYVITHNTTFCIQIGWNIVKNFPNGMLIIEDCEKLTTRQRIMNLTHTDAEDPRIRLIKAHTTIEDVLQTFGEICDLKEAGKDRYKYEVADNSINGKPFKMYEPTVFIIDSLPKFNSKEYNTEDLGNQIDQMKASKDITRFYTNVLDRAWKYNIIFIVINHIRPNSVTNPYATPPRGLMMINPQSETLPRGSVPQYFSSTYFRINSKKSAAYTEEDNGFTGYKCEIQLAKSKTNVVGASFPVTFNTAKGFDPIYSLFEFATSLGLVQGRNPYLFIEGMPDYKFDRKNFINMMQTDMEFAKAVMQVLKPYYEALLGSKTITEDDDCQANTLDIDLNTL